jgi:UDP-glucose 4-epimerase
MKRIVIFGSSGFIGSELSKHFKSLGLQVVELGKSSSTPIDYNQPETYAGHIQENDFVVHLIAPQQKEEEAHLASTKFLIKLCAKKKIAHFLYLSTGGALYGQGKNNWKETDETHPISPYGKFKKVMESELSLICKEHNISLAIARPSNIYGENQNPLRHFGAVTTFYHQIKNDLPLTIFGDLNISKDFLHVNDLVQALTTLLLQKKTGIYNLARGINYSLGEVVQTIESVLGKKAQINFKEFNPNDIAFFRLDNSKARQDLDWNPNIDLKEGILRYKGKA